jgi:glycerol-3-phosphate dehydrogenase (NAD(P)+)
MLQKVTVLGGGGMGTACSILLSEPQTRNVTLWMRNAGEAEDTARTRRNRKYLPEAPLSDRIDVTSDAARALSDSDLIVVAIPTAFLRVTLSSLQQWIPSRCPVVSVVKGVENRSFLRPSEIIADVWGARDIASLCGPSHAEEIGRRLPASVVAAGTNLDFVKEVQALFTTDRFRVYTNVDILGVELAAALKNVLAIAAGISDGLGYGDNAKSALLTRGIVEMTRFGAALGAQPETFAGLAGIGDLITTCFSRFGRNRRVGERLGQGETLAEALTSITGISEGVTTCESIHGLARARQIEMPIASEVYHVLFEGKSPLEATNSLMLRPLRSECRPV